MKEITFSPEVFLNELPHTHYADGNGNISVYTDDRTTAMFLEMALKTLSIPYEDIDYGIDDAICFGFEFRIEDIREECPLLYTEMKKLDTNNRIYKNLSKN